MINRIDFLRFFYYREDEIQILELDKGNKLIFVLKKFDEFDKSFCN